MVAILEKCASGIRKKMSPQRGCDF